MMSTVISVFVATPGTLETVSDNMSKWLGKTPVRVSDIFGGRNEWLSFGMEFVVYDNHGLENDRNLLFEDFSVSVDVLFASDDLLTELEAVRLSVCHYLGAYLAQQLLAKTMVVFDVQREIAKYDGSTKTLNK
jgi:hypothetical protein